MIEDAFPHLRADKHLSVNRVYECPRASSGVDARREQLQRSKLGRCSSQYTGGDPIPPAIGLPMGFCTNGER